MEVTTIEYTAERGWSEPFPEWDSPQTLVIAFGAPEFGGGPGPLRELLDAYRESHVLGCSTAGEISGDQVSDGSIVAAICRFDEATLRSASARCETPEDSFDTGQRIGADLAADDLRAVFVLSDGLGVNGSELARGLAAAVPDGVAVTGGLAGDGNRFEATWVLGQDGPVPLAVSAIAFYGDRVDVGVGCQGGWDPFGPERLVTASRGNVLHTLDGRPALSLYKEYLGDLASGLPATALLFPLALRRSSDDETTVTRTILAIDEDEESLTFAGDIPEGSYVQLMRANVERLVTGAERAAAEVVVDAASPSPLLSIGISCVGRRLVLGERTEEELEAVLTELPPQTTQVGFYSYGEISSLISGRCDLHNQSMTVTTIRERAA
ncbi:MAG: FIST C-terminal domain-containing protein [Thermoleophilia bacterium]|nr:FIST C-terminal domain-containing protein [Thermoleophilia bacterium]